MRKLALITQEFKDLVQSFETESVYKTPPFKRGGKKYLEVLRGGTDKDGWFYYVQRLGKDSVAFALYNQDNPDSLKLLKFWSTPYNSFLIDAFTGSLDIPGKEPIEILCKEVKEESGYEVTPEDCIEISRMPVGSSTNETVILYLVDITGKQQKKAEPENLFEQESDILNISIKQILTSRMYGWRAKLIAQTLVNI